MSKSKPTQLTQVKGFKICDVIFFKPVDNTISAIKPEVKYKHIKIQTKYDDGTFRPPVIPTETCFSFGVKENNQFENVSYSMPIVLYDRTIDRYEATEGQRKFLKTFEDIIKRCKEHLCIIGRKVGKPDMQISEIRNIGSCLYKKNCGTTSNCPML